jgi:hypothetical protein
MSGVVCSGNVRLLHTTHHHFPFAFVFCAFLLSFGGGSIFIP